jgi:hypothetical protein
MNRYVDPKLNGIEELFPNSPRVEDEGDQGDETGYDDDGGKEQEFDASGSSAASEVRYQPPAAPAWDLTLPWNFEPRRVLPGSTEYSLVTRHEDFMVRLRRIATPDFIAEAEAKIHYFMRTSKPVAEESE